MLIRVDSREDALHGLFQINLVGTKHQLRSESLPVGDIILSSPEVETDYIVFERKSLADLAASIRDGRFTSWRGILRDTTNALAKSAKRLFIRPCVR